MSMEVVLNNEDARLQEPIREEPFSTALPEQSAPLSIMWSVSSYKGDVTDDERSNLRHHSFRTMKGFMCMLRRL
jgi:hypothetical protein